MKRFRIGVLSARTQVSVPTIRYYEQVGLLDGAIRQEGGQRMFDDGDIGHLLFIRRCRDFGFSIDAIKRLKALRQDPHCSCDALRDFGSDQLALVKEKIAELTALHDRLESIVNRCTSVCVGGPVQECTIVMDFTRRGGHALTGAR